MKKIVIIGAGYAGACLAKMLKERYEVLVLESSQSPGGFCKSYYKQGMAYEYGPHILANHNCSEKTVKFLKDNITTVDTGMYTASHIQGINTFYPPVYKNAEMLGIKEAVEKEIKSLPETPDETNFETYLKTKIGPTFYKLYFEDFTKKFWMVDPSTLSSEWCKIRHLGESLSKETMFFNEKWCAYPATDWNELFSNLLKGINVLYDSPVAKVDFSNNKVYLTGSVAFDYDLLISTLGVDELWAYSLGELAYAGYSIEPVILDREYYNIFNNKPISMTYFPELIHTHCRITDYKAFNKKEQEEQFNGRTIITIERPDNNKKIYPFIDKMNSDLLERYIKEISRINNVITFGRKGLYKYLTCDTTTEMAFRLMEYLPEWNTMNFENRYNAYKNVRGV